MDTKKTAALILALKAPKPDPAPAKLSIKDLLASDDDMGPNESTQDKAKQACVRDFFEACQQKNWAEAVSALAEFHDSVCDNYSSEDDDGPEMDPSPHGSLDDDPTE